LPVSFSEVIPEYAAKNNIEREAFFTQETKEILVTYLQRHRIERQTDFVFLHKKGKQTELDPIGDEKRFQNAVILRSIQLREKWRQNRLSSPALQAIIKPMERRGRRNAYGIHIYSFKKYGFTKTADVLGELAAHAIAGHQEYLITYYRKTREERAADYRRLTPKLQLFTTPSDAEKQQQAIEDEVKGLPTEALAQVLQYLKTAKKANKW
jgi:hypothetical protein